MPDSVTALNEVKQGQHLSVGIVCHFSSPEVLRQCLLSLAEAMKKLLLKNPSWLVTVIILDNSQDSDYAQNLQKLITEIDRDMTLPIGLVYTPNKGFGAAHNTIASGLSSDLHLILNPDISFKSGALIAAVDAMRKYGPSLVLPKILDEKSKVQLLHFWLMGPLYIYVRSLAPQWLKRFCKNYLSRKQIPAESMLLECGAKAVFSGCCMLFNRARFEEVGGFDERYFLYFEDYDISLRTLRRGAAYIEQDFLVTHFGGNTSKKNLKHKILFVRAGILFYLKLLAGMFHKSEVR